jgi:hypothetical protein
MAPTSGAERVHADSHGLGCPPQAAAAAAGQSVRNDEHEQAVATGGSLRAAYTEFFVDPRTDAVFVRIRDAATDEVLREISSSELSAMTTYSRRALGGRP